MLTKLLPQLLLLRRVDGSAARAGARATGARHVAHDALHPGRRHAASLLLHGVAVLLRCAGRVAVAAWAETSIGRCVGLGAGVCKAGAWG